jgi:NhaC family Na+:H+ antiporter
MEQAARTTVLGVATAAYLPYCFFNLLSPVISLFYGFTGFRIEHVEPTTTEGPGPATETVPPGAQPMEGG